MEQVSDPAQWSVVCEPAGILYAQRPTREEAEQVMVDHDRLIRHFGTPRLEPPRLVPIERARR